MSAWLVVVLAGLAVICALGFCIWIEQRDSAGPADPDDDHGSAP